MPTSSLTVDEARARASLLHVERDELAVDLTGLLDGDAWHAQSTVRSSCREPGASVDPSDGRVSVWTSSEPDGARRAWACVDQPDLQAVHALATVGALLPVVGADGALLDRLGEAVAVPGVDPVVAQGVAVRSDELRRMLAARG